MRRLRLVLAALPLAAAAAAPLWAPPLGRRIDWFAARRVEVTGAALLAPHEVLRTSGVRVGSNLWTDPAAWEARLAADPAIASARVTRVLPHTLRISIVEKTPAALVQAGTLRPATATGELLAVDPARGQVDLPLYTGPVPVDARGHILDPGARGALASLGRLERLEPALLARVSEVRPAGRGALRLILAGPAAEVLLPADASEGTLLRLNAALLEVARRAAGDSAAATRRPRLDARFDDQVVVSGAG
jgi:cell division protein FtsQ